MDKDNEIYVTLVNTIHLKKTFQIAMTTHTFM